MKHAQLRLVDYLGHILQAIQRIQQYTANMDESAFKANHLVQDAVIRNLEIVGEASKNIWQVEPTFAALNPSLPLGAAYEMRNVLSHGYFRVDLEVVWRTVQQRLPDLHDQVTALLKTA
jgi:uncharacterized protein with HEPN domain